VVFIKTTKKTFRKSRKYKKKFLVVNHQESQKEQKELILMIFSYPTTNH